MGGKTQMGQLRQVAICGIFVAALAACDDNGEFAFPTAVQAEEDAPILAINAPNQQVTERDVERPDIFSIVGRGLWDGRPSLGGAWVAHPDVIDPERVVIRNTENGRELVGALFRRERDNPGPLLQVSSDAAEVLGLLPGAPTPMSVVVLRREEIEVAVPEADRNPVVGSLEAPVSVAETPLDADGSDVDVPAVAVALPAAVVTAGEVVEETAAATVDVIGTGADAGVEAADTVVDVSGIIAPTPAPADGPSAQVGVFSVQGNANAAASQITQAGITAQVVPVDRGGRTVWQVIAGPLAPATGIAQLQGLGFLDAVIIPTSQ